MQSSGSGSIFDSCTGTDVAVGFGVCDDSDVDVCSDAGEGVSVSRLAGEFPVGGGIACVQAESKHKIDATQINTLGIILKFLLLVNRYRHGP